MDWDYLLKNEQLIGCRIQYTDMGMTVRGTIKSAQYSMSAHYDGCEIQLQIVGCHQRYCDRMKAVPDRILSFPLPDRQPTMSDGKGMVFTFKDYGRGMVYHYGYEFPDETDARVSHRRALEILRATKALKT